MRSREIVVAGFGLLLASAAPSYAQSMVGQQCMPAVANPDMYRNCRIAIVRGTEVCRCGINPAAVRRPLQNLNGDNAGFGPGFGPAPLLGGTPPGRGGTIPGTGGTTPRTGPVAGPGGPAAPAVVPVAPAAPGDRDVPNNPGNDKAVGNAGENPSAGDWGGGSQGRGDAESKGGGSGNANGQSDGKGGNG